MVIFDIAKREHELAELEVASSQPNLWDDAQKAQKIMQAVARVREDVVPYQELRQRLEDAATLLEMAELESDPDAYEAEIRGELAGMDDRIEQMEVRALLAGPYDKNSAILDLKAGAGGTDACDWAAMLLRMYLRWADEHGFKAEIDDELPGDVAGISSASVSITGNNVYGLLRSEHGVHRLVRISPFNASGKRQTSFAGVEVIPQIEEDTEIIINEDDIKVDTFRASGAGGQHVNKTSSAVRITHIPTGIVVSCQNERSQLQNKAVAMQSLKDRLAGLKAREEEAKMAAIKGEQRAIEWGSQIRSYVFQPYTLVKDHRNGTETSDVNKVMDGGIDPFITGYLRWRSGSGDSGGGYDDDL